MSRRRDNYENSRWMKFRKWVDGEVDPLDHGMEIKIPGNENDCTKVQYTAEAGGEGRTAGTVRGDEVLTGSAEPGKKAVSGFLQEPVDQKLMNQESVDQKPVNQEPMNQEPVNQKPMHKNPMNQGPGTPPSATPSLLLREERGIRIFHRFYQVMSVLLCFSIIFVLLWTIAYLPVFGNAGNPDNNEVSARYIEKGLEETGAVNIVTGMILDYRAFDTFGESCVLFIASCCVFALLRIDAASRDKQTAKRLAEANDRLFEPKNDIILQKCACVLVPLILVFGIYIVLNGHLSPGGGFSGGAVLGSGLILYLNAFGFQKTERFFTEKVYRRITLAALTFYCLAKSYSFYTGANHLESHIPLGTPGAILSSGLILPLNICVGLVVACTMYAFYTLFRKGGM
ncbi:hydrogen gas-evolving membrane-bound hydrogenase subunit E [Enterocloster hominis (ex Hitch et al. 2024)]|uniref:hydrogen gas-evolving membrane-bound hydrogenase subunit E n=1 Tax=Enterocloster hominis (ex Hitch et al. 2024) TaxID=1917870 RepID=UPI002F3EFD00